jgi:hypothetical protein
MDKYDRLEKLKKLLDDGALTQDEYDLEKGKLLNAAERDSSRFWGMEEQEYCMFMHFSQFLGFIAPVIGLAVPVVMWAIAKDYSKAADSHGRIIFNWLLSCIIYFIIASILIFVVIGIPLILALVVVNFIFVILGAIKARNGEEWEYPLSIPFFRKSDRDYQILD